MNTSQEQPAQSIPVNYEVVTTDSIQQLVDKSVSKSVSIAIQSAMGSLQDSIAKSISIVLDQKSQNYPSTPSDQFLSAEDSVTELAKGFKKASKSAKKRKFCRDSASHKPQTIDTNISYKENPQTLSGRDKGDDKSHKRPSAREDDDYSRAMTASKRAKNISYKDLPAISPPSESDSDSEFELPFYSDEDSSDIPEESCPSSQLSDSIVLDSQGIPFFNPDHIKHPRSGEWVPHPQISKFLSVWVNKNLDKTSRSKLKAECPRPTLPQKISVTPELDPIITKYLIKTGKNPKRGLDRSFRSCQDKLLDLLGPLTKILDLSEQAVASNQPVDTAVLRGWAQRAICFFGNVNSAISAERRRNVLMKLDPQLSHLANAEPDATAEGLLFGDTLIKEIGKFVGVFTSLDKAKTSLKKVGLPKVFGRAGRGRGRFPSRSSYFNQYQQTPFQNTDRATTSNPVIPTPFFPTRGRPWRGRGHRGFSRPRSSSAY